ncbi:MAG: class I SAM-dependent methyltransferase [Candidatus Bathyarchaeia archaeon]
MKYNKMSIRTEQIIKYVKGPCVLDVGCTGHIVEPNSPYWVHGQLCKYFPNVVGIDISADNIEHLKSWGYENVHVASAEKFTLNQKFDTIVAGELIEHLSNPGLFLERAREHLAPDGRIVITTPYPFSLLYSLYAFFKFPRTCQNLEHTCWFCPQTIREITSRLGLRVVHWDLIEDYRPDDPSLRYRIFVKFISLCRWFLPKRLRCNTMVFVLEKDENPAHSQPLPTARR